jgi:hypothetical protein
VKAGKRAFSFCGRDGEYRFTPEGTVTSTPRDGSEDSSRWIAITPATITL